MARRLRLLLVLTWLAAGCGGIGHRRLPGPSVDRAPADAPDPVLLVVVDGLHRAVLADYVAELVAADLDPDWPSGLALLGQDGFTLLQADRVEAPAPAVGLGPLATLATGAFAGAHGIPGSRLWIPGPAGQLRSLDFLGARDAGALYTASGFDAPEGGGAPLADLTAIPTLAHHLSGRVAVTAVFDPFGDGAQRWVPTPGGAGISALMPNRIGAAATPLFDGAARAAAIEAVRAARPPDLLTLYLREVLAEGCLETARRCQNPTRPISLGQREVLGRLDDHLWRLLRTWRAAHPQHFKRLTVILVSTGGIAARPEDGRVLRRADLIDRLSAGAGQGCDGQLAAAAAAGDLVVALEGAAAFLTLRRRPLGQTLREEALRACLAAGLAAAVQEADPWLGAYALAQPGGVEVALSLPAALELPASRRDRVRAQLAWQVHGQARRVDATLVLAEGAVTDAGDPLPFGLRGGLTDVAAEAALLVAAPAFAPTAARALRAAHIELTDVAPTVAGLLGVPLSRGRPPFLIRSEGRLTVPSADRVLTVPSQPLSPMRVFETPEGVVAEYVEAAGLWPPDRFIARLGEARWTWDPDSGTFAGETPCDYAEDAELRRWTCRFPPALAPAGRHSGALWRQPAPDDDAPADSSAGGAFELVIGDGQPALSAEIHCVDEHGLDLKLKGHDALGLDRLSLLLADAHGAGSPDEQPQLATTDHALGEGPLTCPATGPCGPSRLPTELPERLKIRFDHGQIAALRGANRLAGARRGDPAGLQARWRSDGGDPALTPREGYLALRLCNAAGRCAQRALADLAGWDALRKAGCP